MTLVSLTQTCFACPSSWEGRTADNKEVYFRFRHGEWRVDVDDVTVVSGSHGDTLLGFCTWDEIRSWAADAGLDVDYVGVAEVL